MLEIVKQKAVIKIKLITQDNNSKPVTAIAEVFGIKGAIIISTFIPLLVLILEPLAIGLTIAANAAWLHRGKSKKPILENNLHKDNNSTNKLKNLQKNITFLYHK